MNTILPPCKIAHRFAFLFPAKAKHVEFVIPLAEMQALESKVGSKLYTVAHEGDLIQWCEYYAASLENL